ncbi:MAG: GLUG motif-containing protein [Planctomycetota bacterium]|jgi:hypothetical protein
MFWKKHGTLKITLFVLFAISLSALPVQAKYGGGSGTSNDPYLIYDANQMNAIGADSNDWDKHFKLMADLDLSGYTGTSFNIIGSYTPWLPFSGVFDGNDHTISNFTYDSNGVNYIGLFGYVSDFDAEIKNLGLIDPNVDAGTGDYVGSLAGYLYYGTITDCYVDGGSISGGRDVGGLVGDNSGTITKCYSTGSVSGTTDVGGLVGLNSYWCSFPLCVFGTITNCYSSGGVWGVDKVGGLVGHNNNDTISNCYSSSDVLGIDQVGGFVGHNNNGTISYCYSTGSVLGTGAVGGLVGYDYQGEVSASFWDVNTSGQTTSSGGTGKSTAEMQTASTFFDWGCGSVWTIDEGNDYPRLWWENRPGELITTPSYGGGSGDANDPYLIYTVEHLNMIALIPCHLEKHFKLMVDIDLSEYAGTSLNIIRDFTGVFDGNNHTVSNLRNSLFGVVTGGRIKNLGLINPNIVGNASLAGSLNGGTIDNCYVEGASVTGHWYVGGLVGGNDGTISNCYSNGIIHGAAYVGGVVGTNDRGNISYCYFEGTVTGGGSYSGGIAGINWSYATISNCYSSGSVYGPAHVGGLTGGNVRGIISDGIITNCYSTSTVEGGSRLGGLVGMNKSVVLNSYSTGSVSGVESVGGLVGKNLYNKYGYGEISNCYSAGSVSGTTDVGGLVGYDDLGVYNSSFWDSDVNPDVNGIGNATDPDVIGETTVNMQTESTFTDAGWDFVNIWDICEGTNYPRFVWQIPPGDFLCPDGVNFFDYSFFALQWAEENCAASNDCDGRDLDLLGSVDIKDLRIFAYNWLEGF